MSDDINPTAERLARALDGARCKGNSSQPYDGNPPGHCAECCFGTYWNATSAEDLELLNAADAALRALRSPVEDRPAAKACASVRPEDCNGEHCDCPVEDRPDTTDAFDRKIRESSERIGRIADAGELHPNFGSVSMVIAETVSGRIAPLVGTPAYRPAIDALLQVGREATQKLVDAGLLAAPVDGRRALEQAVLDAAAAETEAENMVQRVLWGAGRDRDEIEHADEVLTAAVGARRAAVAALRAVSVPVSEPAPGEEP